MQRWLDQRGLTLVELMTVMVILALVTAALFTFFIGASKGAAQTRKVAYAGQTIERTLSVLRLELAGATDLSRDGDKLVYRRVRDEQLWVLEVLNRELFRSEKNHPANRVLIARDIDIFEFTLPTENISDETGMPIFSNLVKVVVKSGSFQLDDVIYLRNRQ